MDCREPTCDRRVLVKRTRSPFCWEHRPCAVCGGAPARSVSRDERWPGHWCDVCDQRARRTGDPTEARPYGEDTVAERFARYCSAPDDNGCVLWLGDASSGHMGYGRLKVDGSMVHAHRVAWELEHGPIPDGQLVLHHCDVPPCVNVEHLHLGSHALNMRECLERGRKQLGLTEEEVREARHRHADGVSMTRLASDLSVSLSTVRKAVRRLGAYALIE